MGNRDNILYDFPLIKLRYPERVMLKEENLSVKNRADPKILQKAKCLKLRTDGSN